MMCSDYNPHITLSSLSILFYIDISLFLRFLILLLLSWPGRGEHWLDQELCNEALWGHQCLGSWGQQFLLPFNVPEANSSEMRGLDPWAPFPPRLDCYWDRSYAYSVQVSAVDENSWLRRFVFCFFVFCVLFLSRLCHFTAVLLL